MSTLYLLAASLLSFSGGSSIEASVKDTQATALVRRESHGDNRLRSSQYQGRMRRQRGRSSSFIQRSPSFPAYERDPQYVYPLTDAGKELETRAVEALTPTLVMDYLRSLISFPTRSYTNLAESEAVEKFLKNTFKDIGLTSCFHTFASTNTGDERRLTNVVGYIPGSTSDSVVLGAHYDSRPYDGSAPGAEDNGSGVAALLAIAKTFKATGIKPKASVYFVAFAGEEPGLIGSEAFAHSLQKGGDDLPEECKASSSFLLNRRESNPADNTKVIVMDEIGWSSPVLDTPTVNLESYDWTKPVMDHLVESSQTHNGEALRVVHSNHPFGSDHMSFLDNHIMAVLTINGKDEDYPNYHQSSDTIDNVDPRLLAMISKMNLGALIRMAGA